MERATGTEVLGCGSPRSTDITLNIQTTTGGNFSISVNGKNTVEHLKKVVSKKLKVAKDRICLLHRERQLREGTLEENGLLDGARVILLPSVETGLLSQRPENSVMQALESLNENQVNDFLSGKSPLNLTMRLGDHMMLIQLQLSTLSSSSNSSRTLRIPTTSKNRSSSPVSETKSTTNVPSPTEMTDSETSKTDKTTKEDQPQRVLQKQDLEILKNAFELYRSMTDEKFSNKLDSSDDKEDLMDTSNCTVSDYSDTSIDTEQSPIKSLSNLVSNPVDENMKAWKDSITLMELLTKGTQGNSTQTSNENLDYSQVSSHSSEGSDLSNDSDTFVDQSSFLAESTIDEYPMEHLFNSAVDKGLFEDQEDSVMDREISNLATTSHGTEDSTPQNSLPSFKKVVEPLNAKRFHYLLHKTSKLKQPNVQNKQKAFMQSVVNKHRKRMQNRLDTPSSSRTEPFMTNTRKLLLQPSTSDNEDEATPSTSKEVFKTPDTPKKGQNDSSSPQVETKDLMEASKNLTQKLKKLSKEVLTNKIDLRRAEEAVAPKTGPGAVIESMKHHGKGIYSGTFSGTLNPALQDRYGRPKRDISTIIHILNDLLCASPPIAVSTKDAKHSCSNNASSSSKSKCMGCSQPSCSYGQCDGHTPSTSSGDTPRKETKCGCTSKHTKHAYTTEDTCPSCAEKTPVGDCRKCDTAKSLALDNSKTKCKLEQLRLVMQQKKQRREARKMKTLPYNTPPKSIGSPEAAAASIQEEIETVA